MMRYALRRLTRIPLVMLVTFVIAFALVRAAPQSRDAAMVDALDVCEPDAPFVSQLVRALVRWTQLDRDPCTGSARDGVAVVTHVRRALPTTLALAGGALLFAVAVAVTGGAVLARGSRRTRRAISLTLSVLEVVPAYVVAPALLWVFGLALGAAPVARPHGAGLLLPIAALGLAFAASQARAVHEVLSSADSVSLRRAMLARGHAPWRAQLAASRIAVLPILGALGATTSALAMSAMAVEIVFSMPGLGQLAVDAAQRGDVNVLFGSALTYAAVLLCASAVFDVAYALLDPRVRGLR